VGVLTCKSRDSANLTTGNLKTKIVQNWLPPSLYSADHFLLTYGKTLSNNGLLFTWGALKKRNRACDMALALCQ
jgi:hypothetical protein